MSNKNVISYHLAGVFEKKLKVLNTKKKQRIELIGKGNYSAENHSNLKFTTLKISLKTVIKSKNITQIHKKKSPLCIVYTTFVLFLFLKPSFLKQFFIIII